MKREEREGENGVSFTILIPENEDDVAELREMAASGELDDRHSFADDPDRIIDTADESPSEMDLGELNPDD